MRQRGFAPLLIILMITILGTVGYLGYKSNFSKTRISVFTSPTPSSNIVQDNGYKLFKGLFVDTKYGFSFELPDYFGRYGGWSSDNKWGKDANPDYLYILPLETAKQEDAIFKGKDEFSGRSKEFSVSVSKNTTIDKWRGKIRTVFNSDADGWGMDHKFTNQTYDSTNKSLSVLKFTYLYQTSMSENPQAGKEFDTAEPVTGIAIQSGSNVIVISMKHGINYQKEVDDLFTHILSTFKFTQ